MEDYDDCNEHGLGDVLLMEREDWSHCLISLEDDEKEIYAKALQDYLIDFVHHKDSR